MTQEDRQSMDTKYVLVTGGAGYIGSHTTLALLDVGIKPIVVDNLSTGFRSAVPSSVPFFQGDSGDEALLHSIMQKYDVEAVIHFAASIIVAESSVDPLGYYKNNTVNACALIDCAVRNHIPNFIFSSSAAVYGEPRSPILSEDHPTDPINPYGRSKLMVEWMLEDAAKAYPIHYAALRYFNVAGADPAGRIGQSSANATHLIKIAVQAALGKRSGVDVFGADYPTADGTCIRDYVHVHDLAQAHLAALSYLRKEKTNLICNIGYATGFSVLEVIEVVKRVSGVDFEVRVQKRRPGDPSRLVASNQKATEMLRWSPRYNNLEIIVRHALEWERQL
jgi:UDP-glucose 4-epimerase